MASVDMTQQQEEELLAAVRQGSEDAFAALTQRYTPMLRQLAQRFRNDRLDAEDLTQEGLLGLLSAANHFCAGTVAFGSYAYVCVRRRMLSAIARTARHKDHLVAEGDWEQELERLSVATAKETDPADQVLRREADEQFYSRLRSLLSEREYQVLLLYLDAYSYDEMAARLGVSVKAVDNALQRVRQKLSNRG